MSVADSTNQRQKVLFALLRLRRLPGQARGADGIFFSRFSRNPFFFFSFPQKRARHAPRRARRDPMS
jgi:hypothetical protein